MKKERAQSRLVLLSIRLDGNLGRLDRHRFPSSLTASQFLKPLDYSISLSPPNALESGLCVLHDYPLVPCFLEGKEAWLDGPSFPLSAPGALKEFLPKLVFSLNISVDGHSSSRPDYRCT